MRALHVLASTASSWGGPPAAVSNLALALTNSGVETTVLGIRSFANDHVEFSPKVRVVKLGAVPIPNLALPLGSNALRVFAEEVKKADIVHLHEVWHPPQAIAAACCRVFERSYISSPHGALEPWCLSRHSVAKSIAWHSYQRRILTRAACLHALSDHEAVSIESLGLGTQTTVIPNCIDLDNVRRNLSESGSSGLSDLPRPYILYIGRLDPKKGLRLLIDAFAMARRLNPNLSLVLAGPDPRGLWPGIATNASRLHATGAVRYLGFVNEVAKFDLYTSAEAFVQPSFSEGQSMAVLEALACGTPVIATNTNYIPEIAQAGAGILVGNTVAALATAILQLTEDAAARQKAGRNARLLAESRFSMTAVGPAMAHLYSQVSEGSP